MRLLSGLHKGQDFVIFGNGPSLLEHRERLAAADLFAGVFERRA